MDFINRKAKRGESHSKFTETYFIQIFINSGFWPANREKTLQALYLLSKKGALKHKHTHTDTHLITLSIVMVVIFYIIIMQLMTFRRQSFRYGPHRKGSLHRKIWNMNFSALTIWLQLTGCYVKFDVTWDWLRGFRRLFNWLPEICYSLPIWKWNDNYFPL